MSWGWRMLLCEGLSHLSLHPDKVVVQLVPPHAFQNSPAPLPSSSPGTPSHHRYQATPIILRGETSFYCGK